LQKQTIKKENLSKPASEAFPTAEAEDFPTRRALEELNEKTRKHYVTKHGGGTEADASAPEAMGPMDHEA